MALRMSARSGKAPRSETGDVGAASSKRRKNVGSGEETKGASEADDAGQAVGGDVSDDMLVDIAGEGDVKALPANKESTPERSNPASVDAGAGGATPVEGGPTLPVVNAPMPSGVTHNVAPGVEASMPVASAATSGTAASSIQPEVAGCAADDMEEAEDTREEFVDAPVQWTLHHPNAGAGGTSGVTVGAFMQSTVGNYVSKSAWCMQALTQRNPNPPAPEEFGMTGDMAYGMKGWQYAESKYPPAKDTPASHVAVVLLDYHFMKQVVERLDGSLGGLFRFENVVLLPKSGVTDKVMRDCQPLPSVTYKTTTSSRIHFLGEWRLPIVPGLKVDSERHSVRRIPRSDLIDEGVDEKYTDLPSGRRAVVVFLDGRKVDPGPRVKCVRYGMVLGAKRDGTGDVLHSESGALVMKNVGLARCEVIPAKNDDPFCEEFENTVEELMHERRPVVVLGGVLKKGALAEPGSSPALWLMGNLMCRASSASTAVRLLTSYARPKLRIIRPPVSEYRVEWHQRLAPHVYPYSDGQPVVLQFHLWSPFTTFGAGPRAVAVSPGGSAMASGSGGSASTPSWALEPNPVPMMAVAFEHAEGIVQAAVNRPDLLSGHLALPENLASLVRKRQTMMLKVSLDSLPPLLTGTLTFEAAAGGLVVTSMQDISDE